MACRSDYKANKLALCRLMIIFVLLIYSVKIAEGAGEEIKIPASGGIFIKGTMPRATLSPIMNKNVPLKYTGSSVTACIVDTGTELEHPAFMYRGSNSKKQKWTTRVLAAENFVDSSKHVTDNSLTGTMVAGISAGYDYHPVSGEYIGIAPSANLMLAKVFDNGNLAPANYPLGGHYTLNFNWERIRQGFQWCLDMAKKFNIGVISFAHGTAKLYSESTCSLSGINVDDLIDKADTMGIPVVVPSGNNESTTQLPYPACNPKTISVGATYFTGTETWHNCSEKEVGKDKIPCFTNREKTLDLLAPGVQIYSTVPQTFTGAPYGHTVLTGTPIASAIVVGNIILLKQYLKENNRNPSAAEIEHALKETGTPVYDEKTGLTFPRIDVYRAMYSYFKVLNVPDELDTYVEEAYPFWENKINVSEEINFSITVNWKTNDSFYIDVWDSEGHIYTKETKDPDFVYEGAHPIKMTFKSPKKGNWAIRVNGNNIKEMVEFGLKIEKEEKTFEVEKKA